MIATRNVSDALSPRLKLLNVARHVYLVLALLCAGVLLVAPFHGAGTAVNFLINAPIAILLV